uniref:Obscurin-like protein 1 n=1 Tax=Gadus morhua TaxID=8049 RepID=A0A8C5BIN0_GADMO
MDIFGGAPRVLGYPRPVVVQCGINATLKCQIGGDPRPDVVWERKNVQILSEGRYQISEDGKAYLLTICAVTLQDAGVHNGTKPSGNLEDGEWGGQLNDDAAHFLIKPISLRVDRGEDAAFSCKLWGTPLPKVVWEKDGKKLNDIFESAHYSVSIQDGNWFQLKIFRTRLPDKGVYTCRAANCHGQALAGAVLLVEAVPEYAEEPSENAPKVKKFAVSEGKHAKFRCFVTGKPKPEIIWKKDGVPLDAGRRHYIFEDREGYYTLKVLYSKVQDSGLYVCAASNALGNTLSAVQLSVKGPAVRFKQSLTDVEVSERGTAVLECDVPDEVMSAAWYLEDKRLAASSKYGMEQKGTRRRLTIRDVGADDDGVYLCEMPDGGKSIAELTVKGTIVRKLPRKLEVLEGENAAFCVEVEADDLEVHWFKDSLKLRETHQTILKSFNQTHVLVFINVAHQDTGVVTFVTGRSKTSCRLKVKAARHSPPICPVGVQMDVEYPNGVLLSWVPVSPSTTATTRSIFVVERQEAGSQEWSKCFTSETATQAEVTGDSVPVEGNYRFRVCCINKYGRSGHVEFPNVVHLVPGPKIRQRLQGCEVAEGEEARFSLELSASLPGTWFLNSTQLQQGGRYAVQQAQGQHSLVIGETRMADNAAEVTFIANGIRDLAVLKVQTAEVKFSPQSERDREKTVASGDAIVLYCEVSHAFAHVSWFKDGAELQANDGLTVQSERNMRRIVVQSAEASDSGVYTCKAAGDVVQFNVQVAGKRVFYVHEHLHRSSMELDPVVLHCQVSSADAAVVWYVLLKDGREIQPSDNFTLQAEGGLRRLIIRSAEVADAGAYTCHCGDRSVEFDVNPPVMIVEPRDDVVMDCHTRDEVLLQCELSRSTGTVHWYKDGALVEEDSNVRLASEGPYRRLSVLHAAPGDSGEYVCDTDGDSVFFQLTVAEAPVRIVSPEASEVELTLRPAERLELSCQLSRLNAPVRWYRDGLEVEEGPGLLLEADGARRSLVVPAVSGGDGGEYVCDTQDDCVAFLVTVAGETKLKARELRFTVSDDMELECELSRADAVTSWYKDGRRVEDDERFCQEEEGAFRSLVILCAELADGGEYVLDVVDDTVTFLVTVEEPRVSIVGNSDVADYQEMVSGEDLILACEVSRANAPVQWYCNERRLTGDDHTIIQTSGTLRKIIVSNVQAADSGKYVCDAVDDKMVSIPLIIKIKFLTPLRDTVAHADGMITLRCEVCRPKADVQWLRNGVEVVPGRRFSVRADGVERSLTIHRLTAEDAGEYVCDRSSLKVQEAQVMFTRRMEAVMGEEFGEAVLETEVSLDTGEVQWMRQGVVIQPGPRHALAQDGCTRRLTVRNLSLADRGTYRCETLHDRTQVKLNVEPRKISMHKALGDQETFERETASFEVELSHADVEGVWQKDGIRVKPNNQWRVSSNGLVHGLTLSNLTLEDSGTIMFSGEGVRTSARLTVKELPVSIVKPLRDRTALEKHRVILECIVSTPRATAAWYCGGVALEPSERLELLADGCSHRLVIKQVALGDEGHYRVEPRTNEVRVTLVMVRELEDVEVRAPDAACFRCEVSVAIDKPPAWTLNGEVLQSGPLVRVESQGTVHKLTLKQTDEDMSGAVRFTTGKARSSATLKVCPEYGGVVVCWLLWLGRDAHRMTFKLVIIQEKHVKRHRFEGLD